MKKYILILCSCIILGCYELPPRPIPVEPDDTGYCDPGCKHLKTLKGRDNKIGCEESRDLIMPSGDIVSCLDFCEETQRNGRSLHPRCWVEIKECKDIERKCRW